MRASRRANVGLAVFGWTVSRDDKEWGAESVMGRVFAKLVRIKPMPVRGENTLPWLGEVRVAFVAPEVDGEDGSHLEFQVYPPAEEGDYSTEAEAEENEGEIGVPDPIATVRVYPDGRVEHGQ